jgi:hypothetical protein
MAIAKTVMAAAWTVVSSRECPDEKRAVVKVAKLRRVQVVWSSADLRGGFIIEKTAMPIVVIHEKKPTF